MKVILRETILVILGVGFLPLGLANTAFAQQTQSQHLTLEQVQHANLQGFADSDPMGLEPMGLEQPASESHVVGQPIIVPGRTIELPNKLNVMLTQELLKLRSQITTLTEKREKAAEALAAAQELISAQRSVADAKSAEIEIEKIRAKDALQTAKAAEELTTQLKANVNRLNQSLATAEKQLQESTIRSRKVKGENNALVAKNKILNAKNATLSDAFSALQKKGESDFLSKMKDVEKKASEQGAAARKELEAVKRLADENRRQAEQQNRKAQEAMKRAVVAADVQKKRAAKLTEQTASLKGQLNQAKKDVAKLKEKLKQVEGRKRKPAKKKDA